MVRPADEAAAFGADNLFFGGADQVDRHRVGVHDDMGLGVNNQNPGLDVIQDGLEAAAGFLEATSICLRSVISCCSR